MGPLTTGHGPPPAKSRCVPNDSTEARWDDRLLPVLSDDWQSVDALAAKLKAKPFTVLARLKDMLRRNLVERRIVNSTSGKMHAGRPLQQAEFRRIPLG
jgi:predicted ArsR family transcriptional regulator